MTPHRDSSPTGHLLRVCGLAMLVVLWLGAVRADPVPEAGPVPRLLRTEPPRDSARHLGDQVIYRALIAWPPGWEIDRDGLRAPTRDNGPIELLGYSVQAADSACADCRWLSVTWQLFKAVRITSDVTLPVAALRLRKGRQTTELKLPASKLALSPLVPWERRANWIDSLRPGWQPHRFDLRSRFIEGGLWLGAALLALAGWAWSSGRWLPRRSRRPFAAAWRSVKSRPRTATSAQRGLADTEDLRCWHRAFDATAGEVVFAERLDAFFAVHPGLKPLADEVRAVFAASRQAFYLAPGDGPPVKGLALPDLIALLRRLADHEFQLAPERRKAHARV